MSTPTPDTRILTHHKGCAAIDDHHVTDGITFKPCDCCLAEIKALRTKLTEAERERDEARAKLATVERERDGAKADRDAAPRMLTGVHQAITGAKVTHHSQASMEALELNERCAKAEAALIEARGYRSHQQIEGLQHELKKAEARLAQVRGVEQHFRHLAARDGIASWAYAANKVEAALAADAPTTPPAAA